MRVAHIFCALDLLHHIRAHQMGGSSSKPVPKQQPVVVKPSRSNPYDPSGASDYRLLEWDNRDYMRDDRYKRKQTVRVFGEDPKGGYSFKDHTMSSNPQACAASGSVDSNAIYIACDGDVPDIAHKNHHERLMTPGDVAMAKKLVNMLSGMQLRNGMSVDLFAMLKFFTMQTDAALREFNDEDAASIRSLISAGLASSRLFGMIDGVLSSRFSMLYNAWVGETDWKNYVEGKNELKNLDAGRPTAGPLSGTVLYMWAQEMHVDNFVNELITLNLLLEIEYHGARWPWVWMPVETVPMFHKFWSILRKRMSADVTIDRVVDRDAHWKVC